MNYLRHIKSPCIFRTLFFEVYSVWNTPLYVLDLRLIENLVIFRVNSSLFTHFQNILRDNLGYSRIFYHIFRHIHVYSSTFRILCNRGIFRTLAYLESWNIQKPIICRSKRIFIIIAYSESWNIQGNGLYTTSWIVRFLLNI